ncbi:hypothetical protein C8R43DRAFT_1125588 [Mycena crocata]|nr:hypothetical protein C8R43DRAFT_1125588 [Mycena crocata]
MSFTLLVEIHRVCSYLLPTGCWIVMAVPHRISIDYGSVMSNPDLRFITIINRTDGWRTRRSVPNMIPTNLLFTRGNLASLPNERAVMNQARYSAAGGPAPEWSSEEDMMLIGDVITERVGEDHAVGLSIEEAGGPSSFIPQYKVLFLMAPVHSISRHSYIILPFNFIGYVQVVKILDVGKTDCLLECLTTDTADTVLIRLPARYLDPKAMGWMSTSHIIWEKTIKAFEMAMNTFFSVKGGFGFLRRSFACVSRYVHGRPTDATDSTEDTEVANVSGHPTDAGL